MSITDTTFEAKATRWGEVISAAAATGRPIEYIPNSTYNEHLDVLPDAHIGTNKIPTIKWLGLGVGSDYMKQLTVPTSGAIVETPTGYIHNNMDAIPFLPFPFAMRREGDDNLPANLRARLAGRSKMVVDGENWIGWFLSQCDDTASKVEITKVTTDDDGNEVSVVPLEPSSKPLNPSRDPNFVGEAPSSNEYIRVRSPINLTLTPTDMAELANCASILFDTSDIEISEFSIVGGIPQPHVVQDAGTNISYTEVIGAQSAYFSSMGFEIAKRISVGAEFEFQLGVSMTHI